jgi:hypothetical protein
MDTVSIRDWCPVLLLLTFAVFFPVHNALSARGDLVSYEVKQRSSDPEDIVFTKEEIDSLVLSESGVTDLGSTHDAAAVKIYYETVNAFNEPTTATALVTIPLAKTNAPTLCYNHGTTPTDLDVPSQSAIGGEAGYLLTLLSFSGGGYIGIAADYVGLGENAGFHPYHHAPSQAAAVIDAIRAGQALARQLEGQTGTTLSNTDLFLTGFSQGGHVTMCAHQEIEENPTLGLSVRASAPAAGAYDLAASQLEAMVESPAVTSPFYVAYAIYAYHQIYSIPQNLEDFFVSSVAADIPDLFDGTKTAQEVIDGLPSYTDMSQLLVYPSIQEIRQNFPDLIAKLEENSFHRWTPENPMLMLYVDRDVDVPPSNTFVTYSYMAPRGVPVRKQRVGSGFNHNDVGVEWIRAAREYFDSFLTPSQTTYDTWKSNLGSFSQNEIGAGEDVIGSSADPNRDGVNNLVCYALGLEPTLPAQDGLPRIRTGEDGKIEMRVTRRTNDPSVSVVLETTTNLAPDSWTGSESVLSAGTPTMMGGGFEQVVYTSQLSASELGKHFFRLRIQR